MGKQTDLTVLAWLRELGRGNTLTIQDAMDETLMSYPTIRSTLTRFSRKGILFKIHDQPAKYEITFSPDDFIGIGDESKPCEICGDPMLFKNGFPKTETGEFWDSELGRGVLAHAQCGLDRELELA